MTTAGANANIVDLDFVSRNRRLLAQRLGWPEGAVEECERVDRLAPGWWTTYRPASDGAGLTLAEGYYAVRKNEHRRQRPRYAPNADELLARIRAWSTPNDPEA
jgi:hypothetical protein